MEVAILDVTAETSHLAEPTWAQGAPAVASIPRPVAVKDACPGLLSLDENFPCSFATSVVSPWAPEVLPLAFGDAQIGFPRGQERGELEDSGFD